MICKKCGKEMVIDRILMTNPPQYVYMCDCGESVTLSLEEARDSEFKIDVKVINESDMPLPEYETINSAGCDLRANISDDITIGTLERTLIPTGLKIQLPIGYEAQIRPRSGLALKNGITVINSPGTIDADYRGEICVVLINLSDKPFTIHRSDRIAQMVISKHEVANFVEERTLSETERGEGGFGHTGVNPDTKDNE